jgi:hypothetical protein
MRMLGPRQAAHKLGVSTRTLENWRRFHKGPPYIVLEGQIRYPEDDIEQYLKANTVNPEANQYRFPFSRMIEIERERRARKTASAMCGRTTLQQTPLFAITAG